MQIVPDGPNIPESLLREHESGRVVFFCGAGISFPAGLPGFQGLVDAIYRLVNATRTHEENHAYSQNKFGATLDLLERRLPGQRLAVRRALVEALSRPKLRRKGATDTHAALLRLARNREGTLAFHELFPEFTRRSQANVQGGQNDVWPEHDQCLERTGYGRIGAAN